MREQLLEMWSSVAPAWGATAAYVDARGAHITARMLALTQPRPGDRELRRRAADAARGYQTSDGLELPGVCLVASARA